MSPLLLCLLVTSVLGVCLLAAAWAWARGDWLRVGICGNVTSLLFPGKMPTVYPSWFPNSFTEAITNLSSGV